MNYWTTIIFLAGIHASIAQQVSPLGRFTVDYTSGCSPFTARVTKIGAAASVNGIQYSFEQGAIVTTDTTYTYNTPGSYRIIQYLGESFTPQSDTIYLTVREPLPPQFEVFYCNETDFVVDVHDDYYDYFYVQTSPDDSIRINGSGQLTLTSSFGSGTLSVKGYFDHSLGNCGVANTSFNLTAIQETFADDMQLVFGCSNDYYLQLLSSALDPAYLYHLEFSLDNSQFATAYLGQIVNGTNQFPIGTPDLPTSDSICIRLSTLDACDSTTRYASETCQEVVPFFSIDETYVTYVGENVRIQSDSITGSLFLYERLNDRFGFVSRFNYATITSPMSNFRRSEFKVVAADSCGVVVDSIQVSPPFLRLLDKDIATNTLSIEAEPPQNNLHQTSDSILIYTVDSSIVRSIPYTPQVNLPVTLGERIKLRLQYTYSESITIYSNEVQTSVEAKVYVPKAFTPNGDGLNDYLEVYGLPTENFTILIFDRWGKVIRQSTSNPVWDGKRGKNRLSEGKYLYRISFELESGELKTQVGTFVILRN